MSTVDAFRFLDYNFTLQPTSERFSIGAPNAAGMIALNASLAMLEEVGMQQVAERINFLTDALITDLQVRGFRILSSLEQEHRSGIVMVEVPDPQAACEKLSAARVSVSLRGGGLRVSPHFYNSATDISRVGTVLKRNN
jgi:selenocysteine lyase/cysteine desulfurase